MSKENLPDLFWGKTAVMRAFNRLDGAERKGFKFIHRPQYASLKEPLNYDSSGEPIAPRETIEIKTAKDMLPFVFEKIVTEPLEPAIFHSDGAMFVNDIISGNFGETLYSRTAKSTKFKYEEIKFLPEDIIRQKKKQHSFDEMKAVQHGPFKVDIPNQTCLRPDGKIVYLPRQPLKLLLFLEEEQPKSSAEIDNSGCLGNNKKSNFRLGNVMSDLRILIGKDAILLEEGKGWKINPNPNHYEEPLKRKAKIPGGEGGI